MAKWAGDDDHIRQIARGEKVKDKFVAFDIETSKITVEGVDLLQQRPLGISCAATVATGNTPMVWQGAGMKMMTLQCRRLVEYLSETTRQGYTIVTWNGAGFDFLILGEESGAWETCKRLALNHIDMAFAMFVEKGFMVGLQSVCEGMGLPGKSGHGSDAPRLWAKGRRQQVLDYVARDGEVTMNVFLEIRKRGYVRWITRAGKASEWVPSSGRLLTVQEAMRLPEPDVSWMKKTCVFCEKRVPCLSIACSDCGCEEFTGGPWSRSKFTEWLKPPIPAPNVEAREY